MKIVYITYTPNQSYRNPEEWLERISGALGIMEAMARRDTVINIHCIGYKGTLTRGGVEYFFFNRSRLGLALPISLHRQVRKLNPDAIIVRGLIFPLQVLLLRWQLGKKVIVLQHHAERPLTSYKKFLQRMADKFIDAYFFASIELGKPWIKAGQIRDEGKIVEALVLPSSFSPMDRTKARSMTGVSGDRTYLWVGGLDDNKDPVTLVGAFKKFIAEAGSRVNLYMIYQQNDLLKEIESLTRDCPGISLVGKVPHEVLPNWYSSVDFIVSTSHREGIGAAVCEGISCGCIPILTDIPSFRWITGEGSIGLLFQPGEQHGLVEALNKSIFMDIDVERKKTLHHHHALLSVDGNAAKITSTLRFLMGKS